MTRPKLVAIGFAIIAGVGILAAWFARPRPITFPGAMPPATIIGPQGEDYATWLPFLRKKDPRITDRPPAAAIAGFLKWAGGRTRENAPYFRIGSINMAALTGAVEWPDGKRELLTPIPFVNEEKNRDAVLVDGDKEWRVRLPYNPSIGGPTIPPATATTGPWKLTATPEPWIASLQGLDFTILVEGPRKATLWLSKSTNAMGQVYTTVDSVQVGKPSKVQMDLSLLWDTITEVEAVALQYTVGGQDELVDSTGKIWKVDSLPPPGFLALRCNSAGEEWWLANLTGIDGKRPKAYIPPAIKKGTVIRVTGFRKKSEHKLYMLLNVPPILNSF